jgi:tRNA1(Val) A37 N6-methylase TrmN6
MSLAHGTPIVKHAPVTRDAFLGGRLTITQPERGFRAGLDSVLLGAAVRPEANSLLDLGAGPGTASLVALSGLPRLAATLVEFDPAMAILAAENLDSNGFGDRARVVTIDLTAPGRERAAAGLRPDHFATVIANPPFYEVGSTPSPAREKARHMSADALEMWIKAAAMHAAPGGEVIFVHVAERLQPLLSGFCARFGAVTVLPLIPREGEAAHRILIRGIKGSRAPLTLLASRPVHASAGRDFTPEFEAIFRGQTRLHW